MQVSIERLRKWLLAGAGLLVLVVAGFLAIAHYRTHRFLTNLPRKLGADIQQEANSYTWSQTVKGRTVFTVHAAKAIQHKDGKYTLHDVGVTVYGRGQEQGNRVDRIYGKEFELDQAAGIVRAMGEVHLDLEAPAKPGDAAKNPQQNADAGGHEQDLKNARLVHVKTSGLVYLQKLGVAATDQEIEFEYNGLTGHAMGADYNADSGVLLLHSAVKVNGLDHGQPVLLTASKAELNRESRRVLLSQAKFVTVNGDGDGESARQTVEAQQGTAILRPDGSTERLIGDGGVRVTAGDGSQVISRHGEVWLSDASKPESMVMTGDVRYTANDASRQANGEATQARAAFDGQGHMQKVVLTGSVHLKEQIAPANGAKMGSERNLTAASVEMALTTDAKGRSWLRDAKANGSARLQVIDAEKDGKGLRTSSMKGEVLTSHFVLEDGKPRLNAVHGDGATVLEQNGANGMAQTSSGDTLNVAFVPSPHGSPSSGRREEIASAVQQGHVVVTRTVPAKPGVAGGPESDRATAEKATYDGSTQRMTLTGSVEMQSPDGSLWADRIAMEQKTGDAAAEGSVKASYRQGGQGEALHVLAARADLKKANDTAIFYGAGSGGSGSKSARLWQGASQIEAPVLQFERKQGRLTARGNGGGEPMAVHTVLTSAGQADGGKSGGSSKDSLLRKAAVVRIGSREMVYSDESRTAQFTGGVRVESADGVMRGEQATAYLQSSAAKKNAPAAASPEFLGGGVEKVAVRGAIEIEQTGRRATGDRLLYTAKDGVFVLTGTEAQPPRVMDTIRGTVTGRELRFRQQDESVVISNGDTNGTGQRVRTETRVKREQ
ncbi:MAG TPA: LptA/OstA family protein [Edaphobacter sp.]|nr:LptA/OstA family protein [Edaphobacter sp.]